MFQCNDRCLDGLLRIMQSDCCWKTHTHGEEDRRRDRGERVKRHEEEGLKGRGKMEGKEKIN